MRKSKVLILLFVLVFFLSACGVNNSSKPLIKTDLQNIASYEDLEKLLYPEPEINYRFFNSGKGLARDLFLEDAATSSTNEYSSVRGEEDYTRTNIQVEGIDECDVVKNDGSRIYSVYNDQLSVVEVERGSMRLVLSNNLNEEKEDTYYYNRHYIGLYLSEKYFIAIYLDYEEYKVLYYDSSEDLGGYYYPYALPHTCIDIYNKETLEKVQEYKIKGSLNTSRLMNEQLYLLVVDYPSTYLRDVRPWYFDGEEKNIIPIDDIKYIEKMNYNAFTTLFRIGLDDEIELNYNCILGPSYWANVYVSPNAIYLSHYQYFRNLFGYYNQKAIVMSFIFDEDGSVYYGGSGSFEGSIIDQFSMDEYDGFLRIVTTEGWGNQAKNRLYVFERQIINEKYSLVEVGKIDKGLGKPGERVKSARFNADQATVVTFREIDPLYVIDLSDAYNPTIVGELEIPGYSTYQHPWQDNYILGIGYQVKNNIIIGIKLSLFDISDPENPIEVGESLVLENNGWAYSEALFNHKAILIDESRNSLGFSVETINWTYSSYTRLNEYILFTVDPASNKPITISQKINHFDLAGKPEINSNISRYFWNYGYEISRALRIGDYLYAVSGTLVSSHNLNSDEAPAELLFLK